MVLIQILMLSQDLKPSQALVIQTPYATSSNWGLGLSVFDCPTTPRITYFYTNTDFFAFIPFLQIYSILLTYRLREPLYYKKFLFKREKSASPQARRQSRSFKPHRGFVGNLTSLFFTQLKVEVFRKRSGHQLLRKMEKHSNVFKDYVRHTPFLRHHASFQKKSLPMFHPYIRVKNRAVGLPVQDPRRMTFKWRSFQNNIQNLKRAQFLNLLTSLTKKVQVTANPLVKKHSPLAKRYTRNRIDYKLRKRLKFHLMPRQTSYLNTRIRPRARTNGPIYKVLRGKARSYKRSSRRRNVRALNPRYPSRMQKFNWKLHYRPWRSRFLISASTFAKSRSILRLSLKKTSYLLNRRIFESLLKTDKRSRGRLRKRLRMGFANRLIRNPRTHKGRRIFNFMGGLASAMKRGKRKFMKRARRLRRSRRTVKRKDVKRVGRSVRLLRWRSKFRPNPNFKRFRRLQFFTQRLRVLHSRGFPSRQHRAPTYLLKGQVANWNTLVRRVQLKAICYSIPRNLPTKPSFRTRPRLKGSKRRPNRLAQLQSILAEYYQDMEQAKLSNKSVVGFEKLKLKNFNWRRSPKRGYRQLLRFTFRALGRTTLARSLRYRRWISQSRIRSFRKTRLTLKFRERTRRRLNPKNPTRDKPSIPLSLVTRRVYLNPLRFFRRPKKGYKSRRPRTYSKFYAFDRSSSRRQSYRHRYNARLSKLLSSRLHNPNVRRKKHLVALRFRRRLRRRLRRTVRRYRRTQAKKSRRAFRAGARLYMRRKASLNRLAGRRFSRIEIRLIRRTARRLGRTALRHQKKHAARRVRTITRRTKLRRKMNLRALRGARSQSIFSLPGVFASSATAARSKWSFQNHFHISNPKRVKVVLPASASLTPFARAPFVLRSTFELQKSSKYRPTFGSFFSRFRHATLWGQPLLAYPVRTPTGIRLYSKFNARFIFSLCGFLFVQNNMTNIERSKNHSWVVARIQKYKNSFYYKEDIKRFLLRKTGKLKSLATVVDPSRFLKHNSLQANLFRRHVNPVTGVYSKPSSGTMAAAHMSGHQVARSNREQSKYVQNTTQTRYLDPRIKRIRFKPGYSRIWRKARAGLNYVSGYHYRYQHALTKRVGKLSRVAIQHSLPNHLQDWTLRQLVLNSHFVYDLYTSLSLIQSYLVYVNGLCCANPELQLHLGDFVQIPVNLKYYILHRWLVNFHARNQLRLTKFSQYKNNKSRYDLSKQKSYHLPDWIFLAGSKNFDVPKYLEVDFFTLSSFIIYEPLSECDFNPLIHLEDRSSIYRMYNWKYIN